MTSFARSTAFWMALLGAYLGSKECHGWMAPPTPSLVSSRVTSKGSLVGLEWSSSSRLQAAASKEEEEEDWESMEESVYPNTKVLRFLEKKYPSFFRFLCEDNDAWLLALREGVSGDDGTSGTSHTIFVPNEKAFEALGETKKNQLMDPRNMELRDKIASCHLLVGESISATQLQTEDWSKGRPKDGSKPNTLIAGFKTMGGQEIPVGRSKSGGVFGTSLLAKEDGDIVIGPKAKIIQSFQVEGCLVHEMDDLVSPVGLWRYADQLRIPGF